jgi:RNAse (barnase) inhibitor barstar
MKLQIDKKFTDEIRKARFEIDTLAKRQEHIVNELSKTLGITNDSEEYDILWDHLYNGSDWTVEYK